MRKIGTGLFMSLDGVVEADDDWQFAYFDDDLMQGIISGWESSDAVLLGRRTYEGYDRLRSEHPDSPAVAFLDATPKYVVSTTLTTVAWRDCTLNKDDVAGEIARLKERPGMDVLVLGSPTLVRWLLASQLLDELSVTMLPIVVGSGVRLFQDMPVERVGLELQKSTALDSGALELRYVPAQP